MKKSQKTYKAAVKAYCLNCDIPVFDGIIDDWLPEVGRIKCINVEKPNQDGNNYHLVLVHHEMIKDEN